MNLETATPPQKEAILTEHARVVCAAGPGSGKTATVVARIEHLIRTKCLPGKIAAITFTNAAAREMAKRLEAILGPKEWQEAPLGHVGTLHSFCLKMLKRHGAKYGYGDGTAIISPDSAEDLMAAKAAQLSCKTPLKDLLALKAANGRPERGKRLTLAETVIATYLDELKAAKICDYDVLLQEFRAMLTDGDPNALSAVQDLAGEFDYLFTDECQDSAPIDWDIYHALPIANKFYTGDPDQAIYGFRGGRVKEMVDEAGTPGILTIKLEANFRSRVEICEAANRLIRGNANRIEKETVSAVGLGATVEDLGQFENEGEEIAVVARRIKNLMETVWEDGLKSPGPAYDKTFAIISRTNAIADGFRKALPSMGVPVVEMKRREVPRDWKLARAFIELLMAPENDSLAYFYIVQSMIAAGKSPAEARKTATKARIDANAAGKTINHAELHFGAITRPETALAGLREFVSRESHALAVDKWHDMGMDGTVADLALAMAGEVERESEAGGEGVHCLTVHGAKGREFDAVFAVGFEDECYPGRDRGTPEGLEEARRVAFVEITRARNAVYFSSARTRVAFKKVVERKPSRFLDEIIV